MPSRRHAGVHVSTPAKMHAAVDPSHSLLGRRCRHLSASRFRGAVHARFPFYLARIGAVGRERSTSMELAESHRPGAVHPKPLLDFNFVFWKNKKYATLFCTALHPIRPSGGAGVFAGGSAQEIRNKQNFLFLLASHRFRTKRPKESLEIFAEKGQEFGYVWHGLGKACPARPPAKEKSLSSSASPLLVP